MRRMVFSAMATGVLCTVAWAQDAELSGLVRDRTGAVVPNAAVQIVNHGTGVSRTTQTTNSGLYSFAQLQPGVYELHVSAQGFKKLMRSDLRLQVSQRASLSFTLEVGDTSETITVTAGSKLLNMTDASVGTVVDRRFVEDMPLNGRSFQTLIELTPGVVLTKTAQGKEQGQFSINGQRGDANYFTIDGVSANIGVNVHSAPVGQAAGGALPGLSAAGGTNSLVSVDALQEFKIQTSTYAPEFGRQSGGQVQIVTRAGTNEFHGTLFDYFRNDKLDANDWFANRSGLSKPRERQNDFGGVFGGPLVKNRAFFFVSYEGLRLRQPQVGVTEVPSITSLQSAPPQVRQFLNVFPLPNGPDTTNGLAQFNASFSNPSNLNATSIRIDDTLNEKFTFFGRYNYAPSDIVQRGFGGFTPLSDVLSSQVKTQTLTTGMLWILSPSLIDDLRFNYSRNRGGMKLLGDTFGSAVPLPDSLIFPAPFSSRDSAYSVALTSSATGTYQIGLPGDNLQRQLNIVNSTSVSKGNHNVKFGADYRRLSPLVNRQLYQQSIRFNSVPQAITGNAATAIITSNSSGVDLVFTNLSLYGQDTWNVGRHLAIVYGLRWELNPPPSVTQGLEPFPLTGVDSAATLALGLQGSPLWTTTYNNFAPRLGIAYQLSPARGWETVVRGGIGIFYDLGNATAGNVATQGAFPYGTTKALTNVPVPLDSTAAAPLPLSLNPPISSVIGFDPHLIVPRTYQWSASVEQSLGTNQTLVASYIGAAGRRLLRNDLLMNSNSNFTSVQLTRNIATSDYEAMQLQFNRRLAHGLQAMTSYTWSHSIDNASDDSSTSTPAENIDPLTDRGSSDFDVRHSLTGAITYNLPAAHLSRIGSVLTRGWALDSLFIARSATPVNAIVTRNIGFGAFSFRPDVIPGIPIYINDASVPGGKRINRAAFVVPTDARQGTLGRNALRGFPLYQVDLAIRRQFGLSERLKMQLRLEAFNVFNRPNFANPNGVVTSSTFGQATSLLGRSLGAGGGFGGGFNPLYQVGSPRSLELALKIQF